ncbi:carboxypeptidase regulatory-like domain-containing protein [Planctomycetota bacterium]
MKESGSPAIGALVEFENETISADSWTRATTDEEGRYHIEKLPPGNYRVILKLAGRPNMALPEVTLSAGSNRKDLEMERGGVVKGHVIDVSTEQPIQLAKDETMQISESDARGRGFAGMPSADIQPDGSFTLMLPAGRRYFGMYLGPNWRGVNTDRLFENGIDVIEGKATELEIRVQPREKKQPPPTALSERATKYLAERAAIAAIKLLGGWVELESIDGKEHVVEVNMVYHEDERTGREENRLVCDECLSYMQKFPKLKRLLLYREQATDAGLANLRGMDSLEEIWIWDASAVTDAGAAHLAQLKNLRTIHLGNSKITDEALRHFSGLPKIEKLSLQKNHFTNDGLENLQKSTQLKELWLGRGTNEITDDGLRYLAGLTNLEILGLQSSKVTDAGLLHLRSLKNLKRLWTGGSRVTEAGRAELRRNLPKLE